MESSCFSDSSNSGSSFDWDMAKGNHSRLEEQNGFDQGRTSIVPQEIHNAESSSKSESNTTASCTETSDWHTMHSGNTTNAFGFKTIYNSVHKYTSDEFRSKANYSSTDAYNTDGNTSSYNPALEINGGLRAGDRRRRCRLSSSHNAARERCRVKTLRAAFLELQRRLPAVPEDTKLSKLDVLLLATAYIAHLTSTVAAAAAKAARKDSSTIESVDKNVSTHDKTTSTPANGIVKASETSFISLSNDSSRGNGPQFNLITENGNGHRPNSSYSRRDKTKNQKIQNLQSTRNAPDSSGAIVGEAMKADGGKFHVLNIPNTSRTGRSGQRVHQEDIQMKHDGVKCVAGFSATKVGPVVAGLRSHGYFHPVKKWPMRTRLYAGIIASTNATEKS